MGGAGQAMAGGIKNNSETPHDLRTPCTVEPLLLAISEKNISISFVP